MLYGETFKDVRITDDEFETKISIKLDTIYNISETFIFDKDTNRYYKLEESNNLHDRNMDGALVKRRIPKSFFEEVYALAKEYLDKEDK